MRRPLKPFVTEYKTPARRTKDAFDGSGQGSDAQPDPVPDVPRPFMPAEDNSYEAAMRAADALFSGAPKPSPAVYEAASEAFRPAPVETPGRRILQAIDETPVNPFAALEAEHAPKRRGRKPGSKNKPKPVPIAAQTMDTPATAAPPASKQRPQKEQRRVPAANSRPLAAPQAHVPAPANPAPPSISTQGIPPYVPYSWVRTRLRPGEKWKLRIPKVAW